MLVHGYEEWGSELPGRLNGMFAFAIWDKTRSRLFMARDKFGEKPLFYAKEPGFLAFLCAANFNNSALITLDPPTEVRRLSADIQNAVKTMPANLTEKMPISGTSAPFQVYRGQDGGPGFIERDQSGIRVTINNVPLSVCTRALLVGPKGFGMDAFEASDGKAVSLRTRPVSETLCNNLKGRLILTRR